MADAVPPSRLPLCRRYDVALLDLDGVVYVGPDAVPGAPAAIAAARAAGMRVAFVTNNASRTPGRVAGQLTTLGVQASAADVVTSAQAAVRLLTGLLDPGSGVLVIGGEGLEVAVAEGGFRPLRSADDDPAAVVQGFAPDVGWEQLTEGTLAVRRGLPWVASNIDPTLPTGRGMAPGNGALVDLIAAVTGRRPVVAGKPELALHEEAVVRTGATHPLVVGDRLDTDIEGAVRAGVDSLLVLTGVCRPEDLVRAERGQRPTYVSEDLARGLLADVPPLAGGGPGFGGWHATHTDHRWALEGSGSPIDGLRTLCRAVWSARPGDETPAGGTVADDGIASALAAAGWVDEEDGPARASTSA